MDATVQVRGPTLSVLQASAMLVGVVIGIGIFKTPPLVAANVGDGAEFLALWAVGGFLMIMGALCYAELSSRYPGAGGEYQYLVRAYGPGPGFLFAFGRMTVMQTGAIAAVAFVFGDYAEKVVPLGQYGASVYAALCVTCFTALQLLGTTISGRSQATLMFLTIATLLMVAIAAFFAERVETEQQGGAEVARSGVTGLALVFILLTYGGWNEAAYLSGEVRNARRNMVRVLLSGTVSVLILYMIYNVALLYAFGIEGLRQSTTIVEGPVAEVFGPAGSLVVALVVCATATSTINATIFTGARSMYALGREFPAFAALGRRSGKAGTPATALVVQGAIALVLISFGAGTRDGFQAMVEYTAPVFWAFLFLVGLSVFMFRRRYDLDPSFFRVPLYPLPPLIFCATCLYLVYSSVIYTGGGALIGIAILAAGVPVYLFGRAYERPVGTTVVTGNPSAAGVAE